MTDRLRLAIGSALLLVSIHALAQDDTTVNAITQTRDGYLWVATPSGLERYNGWDFVHVAMGKTPVASLAEDSTGALWIGSETNGLYRLQAGTAMPVTGTGRTIYAIAEDRMHTIWVASDDGVVRFDERGAHPLATGDGAPKTKVRAICVSGDDVWFGTDEGLVRYAGGQFTTVSKDSITALSVDRDGKLWIGSEHGGVDVYTNGAFTKPAAAAPAALATVVALVADREGTVWISAEGKGLCRLSGDRVDCDARSDLVRAIYEDREGSLWIGTTNSGLHRQSEGMFMIPQEEPARAVLRDRDGSVWTGGPAGLTHNGTTYTVRDGLATTFVQVLQQDRDGAIWIGTSGGLSHYANGKITTIQSDGDADVRALHADKDGRLWIGTTTGLRCVDNGRLTRCGEGRMRSAAIFAFYEASDGTTQIAPPMGTAVFAILRDDDNNLWFATGKGIYRGSSLVVPIAAAGDVQPAAWRSSDGQLWFVTTRGLVSVDPKRAGGNRLPPPVVIEDASVKEHDAEFRYVALTFVDPQKVRYRTMLEGFDRAWTDAGTSRVAKYGDLPAGRYLFRVIAANNDGVWNTRGASMPLRIAPHFWQTWRFAALMLLAIGGVALVAASVRHENARLETLATIDPLTRLANRRSLDAVLGRMSGHAVAVILCDIDHFKKYNDTYGHQAGDQALVRVAQAIRSAVEPSGGIAARYGGEEFIVVLPDHSIDDVARIAGRVVDSVLALQIEHGDSVVTISAGVAAATHADAHDLVREADEALYRAKANGRNRFEMANLVRSSPAR